MNTFKAIKDRYAGREFDLLHQLTGKHITMERGGQPCPICGGTDRFSWTGRGGDATAWYCRHAHANDTHKYYGDWLTLLQLLKGTNSIKEALADVEGIDTTQLSANTGNYVKEQSGVPQWKIDFVNRLVNEAEVDIAADHPYLERKGFTQELVLTTYFTNERLGEDAYCVVVPYINQRNDGIVGVELINEEGVKTTFGGKAIHWIDKWRWNGIYLFVEGYATGLALRKLIVEHTDLPIKHFNIAVTGGKAGIENAYWDCFVRVGAAETYLAFTEDDGKGVAKLPCDQFVTPVSSEGNDLNDLLLSGDSEGIAKVVKALRSVHNQWLTRGMERKHKLDSYKKEVQV